MPASVYEKLEHTTLEPKSMCLQLADQSVRHPLGIVENIPVKIRDFLVPIDFNINGKEEHFTFKPRPERDSTVKEVHEEEPLETPSPKEGNSED